jgi:N-acetylglucosamine-6-phosphate deacetylase
MRAYKNFFKHQHDGARVLGLHMEGPFLNPKLGAQKPEYCEVPGRDGYETYLDEAGNKLLMMTLSPELDGSVELIKSLKKRGIIPAVGHSSAGKDELEPALKAGLKHGTHIFNATRRPDSGAKGVIRSGMDEFCLLHDEISVDIMVDNEGLHFDDILLGLAWKCKGPDKLLIMSDSHKMTGLPPGKYNWDGRKLVATQDDVAYLENGCLAGSIMTIIGALKNIMNRLNLPLEEALQTATVNPAKLLGIEKSKGSIVPGMDADIVVVDESLKVYMTIVEGKIAYKDKSIMGRKP